MSLLPGRRYLSNWELAEERKKFLQKIHDEKTAQGLRQLTPYMYETLEQKSQRQELEKTAFNDAQLKFNTKTQQWQLRDAKSTAEEIIRREAEAEAAKQKFDKMIITKWLRTKSNRGDCEGLLPEGNSVYSGTMPEKLEEGLKLLKENYPYFDINPKENIYSLLKIKLEGRKTQVYGFGERVPSKLSWCGALRDTEKELQIKEKSRFIEEYIANNAERIQKIINEIEGDKNIKGLRKLVGNNSNSNNNLLKFPPREEELKGLFNAPVSSNKTRSRKRKNRKTRKTLRKRK